MNCFWFLFSVKSVFICAFLIMVSDIRTFQFFWILTYTLFCFPVLELACHSKITVYMYCFDAFFFFALSAESVEEIMQLFRNYHQLSEILKEKANTAGMVLLHFHKLNTSFLSHRKGLSFCSVVHVQLYWNSWQFSSVKCDINDTKDAL